MRRNRSVRERRNDLIKKRAASAAQRRKQAHENIVKQTEKPRPARKRRQSFYEKLRNKQKSKTMQKDDYRHCPSYYSGSLDKFTPFDSYQPDRKLNVCHVIHSLGLGGAQTMMFELVYALDKYFGENINNSIVWIHKKKASPGSLSKAYGFDPLAMERRDFKDYCKKKKIDVVLQHRTAMAKCIKTILPDNVKYIMLNHTWHNLHRMREFLYCDCYVSVCNFLHRRTQWPEFIHSTRKQVILNGVENDYIQDIKPKKLGKGFHTGRCHRMVGGKFRPDSLQWMIGKVRRNIPNFHHHLIGQHATAKTICNKADYLHYYGTVINRTKKMAIIKSLDAYYYETFQEEGASIAILESLACGIPVICKPKGGNNELVRDKYNGFLVGDRSDFLMRMMQMSERQTLRDHMRQQVLDDFESRLHVKHTACKYMQLFTSLVEQDANITTH